MKLRLQLYTKILVWFFLNLTLLAVVLFFFFHFQFRVGLDSVLLGQASERIQAVTRVIGEDLRLTAAEDWDAVLRRFSEAYAVDFVLYRDDGSQVAGQDLPLPPAVLSRIMERRGPPEWSRQRRPPGDAELLPGPPPLGPGERGPRREGRGPGFFPRIMERTENPVRYWVGGRVPLTEDRGMIRRPLLLFAVSESLTGGGLFLDPMPWVVVGLVTVGLSVLFWFPLVRGITRSIGQMTRATEQIAEGKFDVAVEAERGDELGRLGQAINRMAARLAGFVAGQKRFLGDTAHELCSPIARIQMALGILEQRVDSPHKDYVEDLREEVQHMSSLVNELLSFSKASLSAGPMRLQSVRLRPVLEEVIQREVEDGITVHLEIPADLQIKAEPELLKRAVANLVRNAIRYAGSAGPIEVRAVQENEFVTVTVSDRGPGVPEEAIAQLFDPFYRLDAARARETGGVGLGLAIVKTCIEACGGRVTCGNRVGGGLVVTLKLAEGAV